jgi:uncharacterized protein (TIGR02145 family)
MKTNRFLSAAIFVALAFTFSACSSDDGNTDSGYPNGGSAISSSSSLAAPSSNSITPSSSSVGGGLSSQSQQNASETVKIGNQTWLKYNLNVPHSSGNGDSWCYEGPDYSAGYPGVPITAEESCAKYGRLYNWAAAMNLPSDCDSISCTDQIRPKHRGICPQGFHIPTDEEWDILVKYVDPDWRFSAVGGNIAGTKLKTTSGWEPAEGISGTNVHGFSALPGGARDTLGSFYNVGASGHWWSSSEYGEDSYLAYYCIIVYANENAARIRIDKSYGFSVRCVGD